MKILVNVMPWFGDGKIHRQVRYSSANTAVIAEQINVMRATRIGGQIISGVIMTWQGPYATFQHGTVMSWMTQCIQRGMLFSILMDPWLAKITSSGGSTGSAAANVIAALNHPDANTLFTSSCYLPEKYLLDFNIEAGSSPAWTWANDVKPHLTGGAASMVLLSQGSGFSWPGINMGITDSTQRNAATVNGLITQNQNAAMKIPAIGMAFNDSGMPTPPGVALGSWSGARDYNTSVWSPTVYPGGVGSQQARILESQGGNFYYDQVAPNVTPASAPYWGYVTWNDYDEQTQIEDVASMMCGVQIGS